METLQQIENGLRALLRSATSPCANATAVRRGSVELPKADPKVVGKLLREYAAAVPSEDFGEYIYGSEMHERYKGLGRATMRRTPSREMASVK
jgi:hypothetical protein